MRRPLLLLLAGYAVCLLFGLFVTYVAHIARAICETPGCGHGPIWGLWIPAVTFAVLFTGIYLVWGRGRNGAPQS
jgi:hypothetical protein